MDMPTPETPAAAYLPHSAYTTARVAADPKTTGRQSALATAHANLKAALLQRDELKETEQHKIALLDMADDAADTDIEGFQLHLLAALGKNRDHVKYLRYFRDGLRAVTTAEPRKEEPEIVDDMIALMIEDDHDPEIGAVVQQWRPKLERSLENVIAADEALTLVQKALGQLDDAKLPMLMTSWREEYKRVEAALMTVYPEDSKRVARFFKPFRRNRKRPKSETPAPTP